MCVLVGNGPAMCAALRVSHSCVNWRPEPHSPLGFVRFDHDEPWVRLIKGHMLGVLLNRCFHNQQPPNPQPGGLYHLHQHGSCWFCRRGRADRRRVGGGVYSST